MNIQIFHVIWIYLSKSCIYSWKFSYFSYIYKCMFYLLCISIYVYIYVYIDIYIKNWKVELLSKSKKLSLWFYSFRCSSMCLLIDFYIYMFLSFCLFYTSIDSYDHSCRYVCIYILTLFKMYLLRFLHLTFLYFYITIFLIISLNPWI